MTGFRLRIAMFGLLAVGCLCTEAVAQPMPEPSLDRIRRGKIRNYPPPTADAISLLREGQRIFAMAHRFQWPRIDQIRFIPTLYVTAESEYLMAHPNPPESYFLVKPERYHIDVYAQDTERDCTIASARPTHGVATVVKGEPSCSGETTTDWLFEYVRCAFRWYLIERNELLKLTRLNLPFPDPKEAWKASFPFPYEDPEVIGAFRGLAKTVNDLFWIRTGERRVELLSAYAAQRAELARLLDERTTHHGLDDFLRYVEWSDGLAHFASYEIIKSIGNQRVHPPADIRRFEDFTSYAKYAGADMRERYQRFRRLTDEPLSYEDIVVLGALTAGIISESWPDQTWRIDVLRRDVWLEDLMARVQEQVQ